MEQFSAATPQDTATPTQDQQGQPVGAAAAPEEPGFGSRGRIRRRARFLRKARELAYRDLGGLVFNLHRFGQRNDALVMAKLNLLTQMDDELRHLEAALRERQPVTVLREAGITACARCAAIHGSEDHFCPNCGLSLGRNPDLPIAVAGAASVPPADQPFAPAPSAAPAASAAPAPSAPAPAQAPAPQPPAAQPSPAQPPAAQPPTGVTTQAFPAVAPAAAPARKATPAPADDDGITEIIRPPTQNP